MRKIILNSQHPLLILPRTVSQNQAGSQFGGWRRASSQGMSGFWPWCYRCNKRCQRIEKYHEGSGRVEWVAECHRHGPKCGVSKENPHGRCGVSEHKHGIEITKASSNLETSRLDARVKFLTFFAPEESYGGTWSEAKDVLPNG